MDFPIVDLSDEIDRRPVARAERSLTFLYQEMRNNGVEAKIWASQLIPIILSLREALE